MSRRFLFTMWEGGGTLPPQFGVARRLADAGHEIHVLGDPTIEARARSAGYGFTPWADAPHRTSLAPEDDVIRDWESNNPLVLFRRIRDRFMAGPAKAFADETASCVADAQPDVVLADGLILGSIIGAQGAGVPTAALVPNVWMPPTPGVRPMGPGLPPAKGRPGRMRDAVVRSAAERLFDTGLDVVNDARRAHGLEPLRHLWDQVRTCDQVFLLASRHFDPAAGHLPDHVRHLGPVLDDPDWAPPLDIPWRDATLPLTVVGLSSTFQDQAPLLQRIVDALQQCTVRAVVTLGQMLEPGSVVSTSSDVVVVPTAPHGPLLADASVAITHCGHGTMMKALAAGVPLVCVPMGRDQDDNAARVVELGVGVRLKPTASVDRIRTAVEEVMGDRCYRDRAAALGASIRDEVASADIVGEIAATVRRPQPV